MFEVTHTYGNRARIYSGEGIAFAVDPVGRVYWASPDGWHRIAQDEETFPLFETGRTSIVGDDYTFVGFAFTP